MNDEETPKDRIDQVILEALAKNPKFELPLGFAERVVAMVERKAAAREAKRDRWWLIGGIFSMFIVLVYIFAAVDLSPFLSGYGGLIIFGMFFVTTLHLIDKFLLRKGSQESG